ncbi:hypothetical protein ACGFZW_36005, partial [Streptomyces sp. NPDC048248]
SLMPLRLARYGVPLARTAPAGLAAAGIAPAAAALVADPAPALAPAESHQPAAAASNETHEQSLGQEEDTSQTAGISTREMLGRAVGSADLANAFHAYIAQYGTFPNSRQFGLYLADAHAITDSETGGPLPEAALRPALQELRREHPVTNIGAFDSVRPVAGEWESAGANAAAYGSLAELEVPDNAAMAPLQEPVTASATSQVPTGQPATEPGVRPSTIPPARVPDTTGRLERWEEAAPDAGAATARKPQRQEQERDTEEQRIEQVMQWLIEAEATGKKLSGAEVARRLEVAPRTGQRAIAAAKEIKSARERESSQRHGRAHLRSVTHRT